MLRTRVSRIPLASVAAAIFLAMSSAHAAVDVDSATLVFDEARTLCERDAGALWGRSLCGPILIVDPVDRAVIASQADANGMLKAEGDMFVGTLPAEVIVANTATDWSGTRWTQLLWPVSFETPIRRVTLAHEMFHRIQPDLGLARKEAGNRHLDTLEGRYLLQLEWRALSRALMASEAEERRARVADALAFRRERHRLFDNAAADENALEINEGMPEYTGVRLGLATPEERRAYAIFDLVRFLEAPSFVRSFAYASGPAYGLLLDDSDPSWHGNLKKGARLDTLLADAMRVDPDVADTLATRVRRYDDGALRASETRRDERRLAQQATYRARLIDGAVLVLPLANTNYQFNPQTLTPLEGVGTIYPTLRLVDDWGDLTVERNGALVDADGTRATVSAIGASDGHLQGDGWRLTLKPGWTIAPGTRTGDWTVIRTPTP